MEPPRINIAWCVFSVADNGIGIEMEFAEQIFQIFKRLHVHDEKDEGSGMGLAVCQRIVEQLRRLDCIWKNRPSERAEHFALPCPQAARETTRHSFCALPPTQCHPIGIWVQWWRLSQRKEIEVFPSQNLRCRNFTEHILPTAPSAELLAPRWLCGVVLLAPGRFVASFNLFVERFSNLSQLLSASSSSCSVSFRSPPLPANPESRP